MHTVLKILIFIRSYWSLFVPFFIGLSLQAIFQSQYQTVVISIISFFLLIAFFFYHKKLHPKKKIPYLLVVLLFSMLPTISLFRIGTYESGDFNLHIYRIMSFYDSLTSGHLMPSWAGGLNASYGNALFIFNYSLPYYIVSAFHFLGFSFIASMKLLLGLTFVFSGIFMYIAAKKILKNEQAAFTTSIFYLFNPYHLIDFHFRATPGESTLFMLAPLIFYFVTCLLDSQRMKYFYLIAVTTLLISMSHPMVSLTIYGILCLFILTYPVSGRRHMHLLGNLALLVGFIASLYLWLPFIIFSKFMPSPDKTILYFQPFYQFVFSPYKYGFLFQGPKGELSFALGYAQLFVILSSLILFFKKIITRTYDKQFLFWLIMFFAFLFLMLQPSSFIWEKFKWLVMLRDRLLLPAGLCSSMVAGFFVKKYLNKRKSATIIYIFILLTIFSTIFNWGHRKMLPDIDDKWIANNIAGSTAFLEGRAVFFANTKWADNLHVWFDVLPLNHLEIIQGKGVIKELKRKSTYHAYITYSNTPVKLHENTLWYPGWKLTVDNNLTPIGPGKRGVITAVVPSGLHYLEFSYDDITEYKYLKILSLGIFSCLLVLIIGSFLRYPKNFSRNFYNPNFFNKKNKAKEK